VELLGTLINNVGCSCRYRSVCSYFIIVACEYKLICASALLVVGIRLVTAIGIINDYFWLNVVAIYVKRNSLTLIL
jgi:hypothetical protein